MGDIIQRLKILTLSILEELDQADYLKLEAFVNQRSELIDELEGMNSTPEISKQMVELLQYDEQIVSRMIALKLEASDGLAKLEIGRQQKKGYDQMYALESVFIDKRK